MKKFSELDSVSWKFFLVSLAILVGPCIWLTFEYTYDTSTTGMRIGLGVTLASFVAAILTFVVNEILFRLNGKPEDEEE